MGIMVYSLVWAMQDLYQPYWGACLAAGCLPVPQTTPLPAAESGGTDTTMVSGIPYLQRRYGKAA